MLFCTFIVGMIKSYKQLGLLFIPLLLLNCRPHYTLLHQHKLYVVQGSEAGDSSSSIEEYLKPFRDSLNQTMQQIMGEAGADFKKEKGGGTLGTLVVDAMNEELKIKRFSLWLDSNKQGVIALTNPGGLRISQIPKGKITLEKAFELLPFENELTLIVIQGKTLKQLAKLMLENGGWPNNANLSTDSVNEFIPPAVLSVEDPNPALQRVAIDDEKNYRILTNDYIAGGGDNCFFLKPYPRTLTGITLRDALIHYLQRHPYLLPH